MITIIAAVDENGIIGNDRNIPWHIPEEIKHFKDVTMGHVVVMGRNTWDSLPDEFKPLPGRLNLVITTKEHDDVKGAIFLPDVESAIQLAEENCVSSYVIGGASIYKQVLDKGLVNRILLSRVKGKHEGDVYFPLMTGCWQGSLIEEHSQFDVWEYWKDED